jgi:7-cyano-7-deazaguanine synthase in queuosine biosynthesis
MSTWTIICRVGAGDVYAPNVSTDVPRLLVPIDQPGVPGEVVNGLLAGIVERTGRLVPTAAADLVYLAVAVYAADLRIERKYGDDRWTRDLTLHLPVSNTAAWKRARPSLLKMLEYLTGDRWQVELRERREAPNGAPATAGEPPSAVSLFSGGLDSFIGAVDLAEGDGRIALVSHYGPGVTAKVQRTVFRELEKAYNGRLEHLRFWVHPPLGEDHQGEPTMRSRSLLFLALGTSVAASYGTAVPLVVPENGLVSLNVPLTGTRLSSLSTRTTHPHFIDLYRRVLSKVGLTTPVELPYRFHTKGQMLAEAKNQQLVQNAARLTMSCAHPEAGRHRHAAPSLHCGYCVPCIVRRAAMDAAGVPDAPYRVDVRAAPPAADSKTGRDLRAFLMALERFGDTPRQATRFHVLDAGPLPQQEAERYADAYVRGMEELQRFLIPQGATR